jgi:hypothetical protein
MTGGRHQGKDKDGSASCQALQPPFLQSAVTPGTALQARLGHQFLGRDVLQLQRSLGNRAVAQLLAVSGLAALQARRESVPATIQRQKGGDKGSRARLISIVRNALEHARKKGDRSAIWDLTYFLKTGQLRVRSMGAAVMPKRSAMGHRVALLRRGHAVDALALKGAWIHGRTLDGKEGWMHRCQLLPQIIILRSGETGSGSTRGNAPALGGRG